MRYVVESSSNTQIQHEGGAREFLLFDLSVRPPAPKMVGHQPLHRTCEVGIDDHRIAVILSGIGANTDCSLTPKEDFAYGFVEPDLDAEIRSYLRHRLRNCTAAALWMPDSRFVFEKRKDREQTRASK